MFQNKLCLVILMIILVACQAEKNESISTPSLNVKDSVNSNVSLDGYWILSDYIDSILHNRSIAKHRIYPITWGAMNFKITDNSLRSDGLLFTGESITINPNHDTIGTINVFSGKYYLIFDKEYDVIRALNFAQDANDRYADKIFTFRRAQDSATINMLNGEGRFYTMEQFDQFFIDTLIAGEYRSLENNSLMQLSKNRTMNGFKNYNTFSIHNYFGTLHPFQNLDAIIFEDSTKSDVDEWPPSKERRMYLNWKFRNDTLILTEFSTDPQNDMISF